MKRPWAWPLVPLYRAGLWGRTALWRAGVFRPKRLTWPVISVGSLSAGGAGKTPVVKMLAELLHRQGVRVDVLSRGYGRRSRLIERVDPAGQAAQFGDEPLEIARAGWAVYVGADRYRAGLLAEAEGEPEIHLLDDGMQHRQLVRELNVVLVTLADARDGLLPAGNLREPLSALQRADVLVLREEEAEKLREALVRYVDKPVWIIRRSMRLPELRPAQPFAFCGLARPQEFLSGVEARGAARFADHHAYTEIDIERLVWEARKFGANGFVTTAKDAVKLSPAIRSRLEAVGPVVEAELQVTLLDEAAALSLLKPLFAAREKIEV